MKILNESVDQMVANIGRPSGAAARLADADYKAEMKEAVDKIIGPAFSGSITAKVALREAMSRSDFPILFGDVMYRELVRRYSAYQPVWGQFARRVTTSDFRKKKLVEILGGGAVLGDVGELEPYPQRALAESQIEYSVGKVGAVLEWSWEMAINDDLGAFRDAPNRLAEAARRTEDYKVTSVLFDENGPKASYFGTVDNKPLTDANLEAALQVITTKTDVDGNPLDVGTPVLVVPRSLALSAQQIVDTVTVKTTANNREREIRGNGLSVTPKIVINPMQERIDKSGKKATTWSLLPDPNSDSPAVLAAFLQGHESPDLRVRNDAGRNLGGGDVAPEEGSFDNDGVQYRVRHVTAGAKAYTDAVYVSTGS